ncbi:pentapeptide repeat-containing protein [Vibrio splendidus]|uniref:pentapeptide repeat-containing protein n=1 Tax=Vibrio splendidus TaxID=29497 RepID=UPI000D37D483|nr:pentapeptide repeat-containing protein [Vibrio splendidus]PTO69284.1 hypothetical protein CWN81_17970 [Vibrio splendidus]
MTQLKIEKPVSILMKEVNFDLKECLSSISKAIISGGCGDIKGVLENTSDIVRSLSLKQEPSEALWLLITKSVFNSIALTSVEFRDLFIQTTKLDEISTDIKNHLNDIEISINHTFFSEPQNFSFIDDIRPILNIWLYNIGLNEFQIRSYHQKFKINFVYSLHQEWIENPELYSSIINHIDTPFTKASLEQRGWEFYKKSLINLANERVFSESFTLSDVYIPLRGYYEKKSNKPQRARQNETLKKKENDKVIIDLKSHLLEWIENFDPNSSIKLLGGGPGSGKSSFAKIFSSEVSELGSFPLLFIPLHHFNLNSDLYESIEKFTSQEPHLTSNPADITTGPERLIFVFDGLDELSMQGQAANEVSIRFIDDLSRMLNRYNDSGKKWQAIVTGRDLSIQSGEPMLKSEGQILNLLPYYVDKTATHIDKDNLLSVDQRDIWWKKLGEINGKNYNGLPDELSELSLTPITKEPLLNYLISLSYERNQLNINSNTSLNLIYKDLLTEVYSRQYEKRCHKNNNHLTFDQFLQVLEEIALTVWKGNGRTASEGKILNNCEKNGLTQYLEHFSEGAKKGVIRLLTAFYFRQFGQEECGDRTFEFTHKSFGEYLTSRRIIEEVKYIVETKQYAQGSRRHGFDVNKVLIDWIDVCGSTRLDHYLYTFIHGELALIPKEELIQWQEVLSELLEAVIVENMPMEKVGQLSFDEMLKHYKNASEALLSLHSSCGSLTGQSSNLTLKDKNSFSTFIYTIREHRVGPKNSLALSCLTNLNITEQYFDIHDFYDSKFINNTLSSCSFIRAYISSSTITKSKFIKCTFNRANLSNSLFESTELLNITALRADFSNTKMKRCIFNSSNCSDAKFLRSRFNHSTFLKLNLTRSSFERSRINRCIFDRCNMKGTDFSYTRILNTTFSNIDLSSCNFDNTSFTNVTFENVKLGEGNLTSVQLAGIEIEKIIKNKPIKSEASREHELIDFDF